MSTDSPYPSRRALREQGLTTGSIQALTETGSIPPQGDTPPVPLTRRERRERERQAETGSLPFPLPVTTPAVEPPVEEIAAESPVRTPSPPSEASASTPLTAIPVVSAPSTTAGTRPLTRRERREMERRGETVPETGVIPVIATDPVETEADTDGKTVAPDGELDSEPAAETEPEERGWSPAPTPAVADEVPPPAEVNLFPESSESEADESTPAVAPAALPPVFAPAPSAEVHTASSREVSVASDQTNALILPVAPAMDLTGPMGDTGEVLVTGNIPLPKQVSEQAITGIVEVDSDEYDVADTGTFSNPIRATHAVSSRSLELAPPMIKKPRWGAASIVLAFSSAVLAVAAVGLLALALMTDLIAFPTP